MRRPENDECPVCGETFENAREYYSDANQSVTLVAAGRSETWCVQARVASASPDPTLIVFEHK